MENIYFTPTYIGKQQMGGIVNLHKIRTDFSRFLRDDRKNGRYNSERINHYQYHMGTNRLQGIDDLFQFQVEVFEQQGLKLDKTIDIILDENYRLNVESMKLLVYIDSNESSKVGGMLDGLSCSLGYFPSDNELTMTEVKFKPYMKGIK